MNKKLCLIIFFWLVTTIAYAEQDTRQRAYEDYINKHGYKEVMNNVAEEIMLQLPLYGDSATVIVAVNFVGTQFMYRNVFDLSIYNKLYKQNIRIDDITPESKIVEQFKISRIDTLCKNTAFRPAMKLGMTVSDQVFLADSATLIIQTQVANADCIKAGL